MSTPRAPQSLNRLPANIGVLAGFRNKVINGDFDIWQRGTSFMASGYTADRFISAFSGGSQTASRQAHTLGQTEVPSNPTYFHRVVVTHAAGADNYHFLSQRVERVKTLSGKKGTLTFYAKADAAKNIAVEIEQYFGSGGSPSSTLQASDISLTTCALTISWTKFQIVMDIPSISGKTLGSNGDDHLRVNFWLEAGSNRNSRTNTLGQQSGTFDISHVSWVEGDARGLDDPFEARHPAQELALCQRYYETGGFFHVAYINSTNFGSTVKFGIPKRATPTISQTNIAVVGSVSTTPANASTGAPTESFLSYRATSGAGLGQYTETWAASAEL